MRNEAPFLPRPKGVHYRTHTKLLLAISYLLVMRIATLGQLATLLDMDAVYLRRQLAVYPYIQKLSRALSRRLDGEPGHLTKVNLYTLSRDVAVIYEESLGTPYYALHQTRSPRPDTEQIERYLMASEIYVRLVRAGMEHHGMHWLPNVVVEARLHERDKTGRDIRVAVMNGIEHNGEVYLVSLYGGNAQGVKSHVKHLFERHRGLFEKAIVFTLDGSEKHVIERCPREYDYITVIPYMWAVKNPTALLHILAGRTSEFIRPWLDQNLCDHGAKSFETAASYRFGLCDPAIYGYVDTTIGQTVGEVRDLLCDFHPSNHLPRVLFVASDEEKSAWSKVATHHVEMVSGMEWG